MRKRSESGDGDTNTSNKDNRLKNTTGGGKFATGETHGHSKDISHKRTDTNKTTSAPKLVQMADTLLGSASRATPARTTGTDIHTPITHTAPGYYS